MKIAKIFQETGGWYVNDAGDHLYCSGPGFDTRRRAFYHARYLGYTHVLSPSGRVRKLTPLHL